MGLLPPCRIPCRRRASEGSSRLAPPSPYLQHEVKAVASRIFRSSTAIGLAASLVIAQAATAGESIIRDTEIEADIRTMVTPIWKAAGLEPSSLHVYLVEDKQINSFVAGGQNEFINSGLIMRSRNSEPADRGACA